MNERILELAEQATKYFPKTETSGEYWTFDKQKFAELIVRECGEIAYKTYWNNPLEVRGIHFKEAMYKRFGIWN
jgi:hypothetical protein